MQNINKYITLGLLLLTLVSIAVGYILNQREPGDNLVLEIYQDGDLVQQIDLSVVRNDQIKITSKDGHFNTVEIKDGQVRVKEADCPNQICVKTGWLSRPGQTSFCAPNRLMVTIKGQTSQVDAITN
ncbi:NusG domain II-containing protein [Desulfoscipio gibsoniae]|uniref:Uncharacterized protein n=1 Tax=Desulfoscipio gibsoniae DSM 7213 TaxID=767817 RepID=R4KJU0_9FIRM|nr:NusG domain II-containing protein [Desulfoscipio gibsoniae]AGK99895.1 hypothetical protein Desgi_0310 [Desulfoscipio gibsoniae DSM 7213]